VAENLKQFLAVHTEARHIFESDDAGLDIDLDYPADYEKARQFAGFHRPGSNIAVALPDEPACVDGGRRSAV
jgi:hypothetical protein